MKRLTVTTCAVLLALSFAGCNRDKPATEGSSSSSNSGTSMNRSAGNSQPDTILPAPVRPGDPSTPAVPGSNETTPMPSTNPK